MMWGINNLTWMFSKLFIQRFMLLLGRTETLSDSILERVTKEHRGQEIVL